MTRKDFSQLKSLLEEQEQFPHRYTHKFVGKNIPEFQSAVASMLLRFPSVESHHRRESASAGHVAYTVHLMASSADEVIELIEATDRLPHLVLIL